MRVEWDCRRYELQNENTEPFQDDLQYFMGWLNCEIDLTYEHITDMCLRESGRYHSAVHAGEKDRFWLKWYSMKRIVKMIYPQHLPETINNLFYSSKID